MVADVTADKLAIRTSHIFRQKLATKLRILFQVSADPV